MFPLLCLPDLPFQEIYDNFGIVEIIHLSQCSKHTKNILGWFKSSKNPAKIEVIVEKLFSQVNVAWKNTNFTWFLILKPYYRFTETIDRNFTGTTWKVSETEDGWLTPTVSIEEDTVALVAAFKSIFKAKITSLSVNFNDNTNFDKLFVSKDTLHRADSIVINECALEESEMTFMLDNFKTEDLTINGYPGKGYQYQNILEPLKFPKILIESALWVDLAMLMRITVSARQVILMAAEMITDKDINHFIKTWMASGNGTLETVQICRRRPFWLSNFDRDPPTTPFVLAGILEDVPVIPEDQQPSGAQGTKIKREDGIFATIVIREGYENEFNFTVSNDLQAN